MTLISLNPTADIRTFINAETSTADVLLILAGSGDDQLTSDISIASLVEIYGEAGDDTIIQGAGSSGTLNAYGGADNDTYVMTNDDDFTIIELLNGGTDTLRTALVDVQLADNVENLVFLGQYASTTSIINGNILDNQITGSDHSDNIIGHGGGDTMLGGLGDDIYHYDSTDDVVTELSGGGTDRVLVYTPTYTLGSNQERAKGWGEVVVAQHLTGNSLVNMIEANVYTTNDTLDGGTGADSLIGYSGNDTYYVNNTGDLIYESASQGTADWVKSANLHLDLANYANVEHADVTGSTALNVTGNNGANILLGNGGTNKIIGWAGNDTISASNGADTITGGAGRDSMTGGSGADDFDFNAVSHIGATATTRDIITDFTHLSDDVDLSSIDANTNTSTNNAFAWISTASFSGTAGQLRYRQYDNAGTANDRTLISGDINGDSTADFYIELTGLITLTASDIVL